MAGLMQTDFCLRLMSVGENQPQLPVEPKHVGQAWALEEILVTGGVRTKSSGEDLPAPHGQGADPIGASGFVDMVFPHQVPTRPGYASPQAEAPQEG